MWFLRFFLMVAFFPAVHASLLPEEPVAVRSRAPLDDFFKFPQFSLQIGQRSSGGKAKYEKGEKFLDYGRSPINSVGFSIEVNQFSFMNIGASFSTDIHKKNVDPGRTNNTVNLPSFYLGFFTRFFYAPPFLKGKQQALRFFSILELKGGPKWIEEQSLLSSSPGIHFGAEIDVSRWIGFSASWGKNYEQAWLVRQPTAQEKGFVLGALRGYRSVNEVFLFSFRTGF
jgi:hypothetical protein